MNNNAIDPLTFQANAAAATSRVLSASNPAEAIARSLTDADLPKITDAAKSYASLVAARSLSTSPTDAGMPALGSVQYKEGTCVFYKSTNPAKVSLLCARALLSVINSTIIPSQNNISKKETKLEQQIENDVIRIVWNGLVGKTHDSGDTAATSKPSKALGRKSLAHAYPHVLKRFKSGQNGDSEVILPDGVDPTEAMSFFEEFGRLLVPGDVAEDKDDDGALIWCMDRGKAELEKRRKRRIQRGKNAVAATEAQVANAVASSSTVTIEEIPEEDEE